MYPAFLGSGIDTNQAYFGSLRNDNGDLYLSKLDFSTSNIEVWTSGIARVSGATSNNPEYESKSFYVSSANLIYNVISFDSNLLFFALDSNTGNVQGTQYILSQVSPS